VNPRRLYRSRHDRQLAGVAAGMAEYLEVDPTLVRILWILSAFLGGFTILLYIILAFVIPLDPGTVPAPGPWQAPGSWQAPGPAWGVPPAKAAGTAPTGDAGVSPEDPAAGVPSDGGPAEGGAAYGAWTAPAAGQWTGSPPDARRGGRAGLFFGVLLVVFGAIAMANMVLPGWSVAGLLWPAFVVALGAALLVGSIRRGANEA
jgi:phage shock protein C